MKKNKFYKASKPGFTFRVADIETNIAFKWFDLWFGFYYDRAQKTLYACPIPTIRFRFRKKSNFNLSPVAVKTGTLRASVSITDAARRYANSPEFKRKVKKSIDAALYGKLTATGDRNFCSCCHVDLTSHAEHLKNCKYYEDLGT